ncbi:MAG: hypothetical protein NWE84_00040 [Candidatus Bathyarchaeota archaeon]|nr:hypothetical protein [Candidatus Bathyarchaeota archaeon]
MLHKKDVETLVALGLTTLQAKIYLALLRLGETSIAPLSKTTNIARQEIYRVIKELQDQGLAEKVLAKPIRYKAELMEEAVSNLLLRINEENVRSNSKAMQLLERHRSRKRKSSYHEKKDSFSIISEKTLLSRRIRKAIEATRKRIKIVTPGNKFVPALFDLSASLKATLERRVAVKWIINKRLKSYETPAVLSQLFEFPNFKLRYVTEGSLLTFGLYDDNRLILATNSKLKYADSQALWTNVSPFIELANNYFSTLWVNSVEV